MSTITTIAGSDGITTANSLSKINTNFSNLNTDKMETSVLDTDTALAANSDLKVATQKAVKTYIDTSGGANASETARGIVEEATDAEVTAGTATGGTGAKLIVTPAKLATRTTTLLNVTMTSIAETVLGAEATSITVSSIPARDKLYIVFDCPGFDGDCTDILFRFNGDTAGNYGYSHSLNFSATPVTANAATAVNFGTDTGVSSRILIIEMINQSATAKTGFYRSVRSNGTTTPDTYTQGVFSWNNTSAQVTSVTVLLSTNELLVGTTLTVYGAN